jgi:hypothetical protein
MALVIKGSSSGQITLDVPSAAGTNTITLPAETGNILTDGSALPAIDGSGGTIVKSSHAEVTTTVTGSGTFQDISGLEAAITPASTSNKILLLATGSVAFNSAGAFRFTENNAAVGIGDPSSARDRASFKTKVGDLNASQNFVGSCILSPNSTSTLTYRLQIEADASGTFFLNRSFNLSNSSDSTHAVASSYLHVFELDGSVVTITT